VLNVTLAVVPNVPLLLKLSVAPEPAVRVRVVADRVAVCAPLGVMVIVELPPWGTGTRVPTVMAPTASDELAVPLPRRVSVPPLRFRAGAPTRRPPATLAVASSRVSVPPWLSVMALVAVREPAVPVNFSVPPLTVVVPV
jgi:hypothetical protein